MIITRSPLRITLGGGGADLPSYYLWNLMFRRGTKTFTLHAEPPR